MRLHHVFHKLPGIAGGDSGLDAVLPAVCQKLSDARFDRHLICVLIPRHAVPVLLDGVKIVRQRKTLLEICRRLGKTHALNTCLQILRQRDSEFSQIFNIYGTPDPHGIHHGAVQIKNNRFYHSASSFLIHFLRIFVMPTRFFGIYMYKTARIPGD